MKMICNYLFLPIYILFLYFVLIFILKNKNLVFILINIEFFIIFFIFNNFFLNIFMWMMLLLIFIFSSIISFLLLIESIRTFSNKLSNLYLF